MQYRLLVSIEVVEFMERLPLKTREALRRGIHEIGRDPLGRSDASEHDSTGRRMQIAVFGDYALMYWVDEADQQIKILDVHAADR
jgi:mRNA-degrading endonuclease RelE of RelBE toxin-antitoxin system